VGRLHRFRALGWRTGLAACAGLALVATGAHAQDATWTGAGGGEWTDAGNWAPNQVPGGTATFTSTGTTTVDNNNGVVSVGNIQFTAAPNAQAYTINVDNTFIINGPNGVTNSSTNTQTFNIIAGQAPTLVFNNGASANTGTGAVIYNNDFFVEFHSTSTAGNINTTWNNNSEIIQFFDSSNAGSGTINNHAAQVNFFDSSRALSSPSSTTRRASSRSTTRAPPAARSSPTTRSGQLSATSSSTTRPRPAARSSPTTG